jgi:hypothetical protein
MALTGVGLQLNPAIQLNTRQRLLLSVAEMLFPES